MRNNGLVIRRGYEIDDLVRAHFLEAILPLSYHQLLRLLSNQQVNLELDRLDNRDCIPLSAILAFLGYASELQLDSVGLSATLKVRLYCVPDARNCDLRETRAAHLL